MRPLSDADAVFQSYGRCCRSERFFEDFYTHFMGSSEAIRAKFVDTDMPAQRHLLRAGLLWLIMYARGAPGGKLRDLGKSHSRGGYDIHPSWYGLWLDALMTTIRSHDPEYVPELERQWRAVMQGGIDVISGAY
ncbi:globin [Isoalcanivorax beigongshangi]|uniref:Globin n=1 Tax=Isoalcanivorax beigongshangi TaxID=3238810 RepID=A0ABV4AKY7_9GAMM